MKVRPLHDWLVVKMSPLDKRSAIIDVPGQEESAIRKGEVVAVGPGKSNPNNQTRAPMGVEPGEKIVFLRWHTEHRPGKAQVEALARMSAELGEDLCMIRLSDILFAYTGDVRVDL